MRVALHWFRRDLRLTDNMALAEATHAAEAVVPVVVVDAEALTASEPAPARVAALVGAVSDIAQRMARDGMGPLIVRVGGAAEELARLAREVGAEAVYANHGEGSRAESMEQSVRRRLAGTGVALHLFDDLGVAPPGAVMTNANTPYTVYTPFRRRWQELIAAGAPREREPSAASLRAAAPLTAKLPTRNIEDAIAERGMRLNRWLPLWGGGRTAHLAQLHHFIENDLAAYVERRNLPAHTGVSRLSAALRCGTISAREALRTAQAWAAEHPEARAGADAWIGELAWADFFRALLHFFPHSERAAFRPVYDAIVWQGEDAHLAAWQHGRTGYPIVDAGMRQLLAEGWMHNRVRMIVASFLVKDLLLDWRAGERHFMRHLADGSVAANVGNWQWAASTGADAQPWFRIFNPTSQGQKFDPSGEYVRRYVPELAHVPASVIHEPWRLSAEEQRRLGLSVGRDYPAPIVDHATQRVRALDMFKAAAGSRRSVEE